MDKPKRTNDTLWFSMGSCACLRVSAKVCDLLRTSMERESLQISAKNSVCRLHLVPCKEKVPQRTFATKISPNFRVNFLVRFASKPLFYWVMTINPLELFRKFFGAVRAIFWLWGSFWAPDCKRALDVGTMSSSRECRISSASRTCGSRMHAKPHN